MVYSPFNERTGEIAEALVKNSLIVADKTFTMMVFGTTFSGRLKDRKVFDIIHMRKKLHALVTGRSAGD